MTTLEAVNYVCRRVGLATVSALETGTTSPAGEIEAILDETRREVCEMGWQFNRREDVTATANASGYVLYSGSTAVTAVALASASTDPTNASDLTAAGHGFLDGQQVTLAGFTTTPTINGLQTIKVLTVDTFSVRVVVTNVVDGVGTATPAESVLKIGTWGADVGTSVAMRTDRLFDRTNNTDVFSGTIKVWYTLLMTFSSIPPIIQAYIAAQTALVYNQAHGVPQRTSDLALNANRALIRARQYDAQGSGLNVLDSADVESVKGTRYDYEAGAWG